MPAISKIRFTNVVYENGGKRYNDDIFHFDGYNGVILLKNGEGKTVFVQTALQAILPHYDLGERKILETLSLEGNPCHIAIEWIINERPRKYLLTAVTLFIANNRVNSFRYIYEYGSEDENDIEKIPFVIATQEGNKRAASKGEINDYYQNMQARNMNAKSFKTIKEYHEYIEDNYKIIPSEWRSIALINSVEGGVETYFENCKTSSQLVDRLLIPVVEEAIAENATQDFVKTFEEQQARFKKHRQLRERIEESKLIEKKINEYVNVFTDYHNINEQFIKQKQYAKAMFLHINHEVANTEKQIIENQEEAREIQNLYKEAKRKEFSYELAVLKEELDKHELDLKDAEKLLSEAKHDYDTKYTALNNLKLAKLKQEIKASQDNIKNYQKQVEILESDIDIEEIKNKLAENTSKIKGYFLQEEEGLIKQKQSLENTVSLARQAYQENEKILKEQDKLREELVKDINKKKGQNIEIQNTLNRIQAKISALTPNESIRQAQQNWSIRVGELEESNIENTKKIKQLDNEKNDSADKLSKDRNQLSKVEQEQVLIKDKINNIDEKHHNLLIEIKELNDSWYYLDSMYTRQDSIINHMTNKTEYLINEKENLLLEERISGRFKDDYGDNSYFTPEPLLLKWIMSWKNQFNYIETGTQYIQRAVKTLETKEAEFLEKYPYWPISIIVDDEEISILKEKIAKHIDKMTFPILILGQIEADKLIKEGKKIDELIVFPKHWQENLNQEHFLSWKLELSEKVHLITEQRRSKEAEILKYSQSFKDLTSFFKQYPYDIYKKLKQEESTLEEASYSLKTEIKAREDRLLEIHNEIIRHNKQISDNKDEINNLNHWIQLAQEYISREREKENNITLLYQLNLKFEKLELEIASEGKELARKKTILEDLQEDIKKSADRINNLIKDLLYEEVKSAEPSFSDISRNALEKERKNLQDIFHEKQGDINKYYEFIKREEDSKKKLLKDLDILRRENDYPVNEELLFPYYGDEEIEKLLESIEKLKPIKKDLEEIFKKKEGKYNKKLARYNANQEQFYKDYKEIMIFNQALYQVKSLLNKEQEELYKKEEKNRQMSKRLIVEKEEIDNRLNELKIQNGKYEYLSETIEATQLEEDFYRDFPYKRKDFTHSILISLEELNIKLKARNEKLEEQKNHFMIFCNDQIKDPRLRERTVAGVKQKNNYEEILEWQSKMKTRIEITIRIAEDDIREHDKDLEQFINHLFTYLRTLTDELNIIPKKTRIKVEGKWKEIYHFSIPSWNEAEGKEELRKHIDWMIKEIEHRHFQNEDGIDNSSVQRKEIEKYLDSRQLLAIVLKNQQIKISCRKVTNDNMISSSLTSWESSNKWSGGEKWSKNMTLFLGILNYVAEKRQGLVSGLKVNRTVILDNPFGKASSEHILDPVFFIAEKLGFQIIALTAHSEGSYIRNYFPVVYSCRLREASNNSTLIIEKEKEIRHAFFRDKNP